MTNVAQSASSERGTVHMQQTGVWTMEKEVQRCHIQDRDHDATNKKTGAKKQNNLRDAATAATAIRREGEWRLWMTSFSVHQVFIRVHCIALAGTIGSNSDSAYNSPVPSLPTCRAGIPYADGPFHSSSCHRHTYSTQLHYCANRLYQAAQI